MSDRATFLERLQLVGESSYCEQSLGTIIFCEVLPGQSASAAPLPSGIIYLAGAEKVVCMCWS